MSYRPKKEISIVKCLAELESNTGIESYWNWICQTSVIAWTVPTMVSSSNKPLDADEEMHYCKNTEEVNGGGGERDLGRR